MKALEPRQLGSSGVRLSPLSFGTMRLLEAGLDENGAADLLVQMADAGINGLHSSSEYPSFGLFCCALRIALRRRPEWKPVHIVKLAEPSFDETFVDADRFARRLDHYRRSLDTDPEAREQIFRQRLGPLGDAVTAAKSADRLSALVCFPYASRDVPHALLEEWCDGVAIYLNLIELDWIGALDAAADAGKGAVTIRPFGAGAALQHQLATTAGSPAAACIEFALSHPAVTTAVVTASSKAHLAAAAAGARAPASQERFEAIAVLAQG